MDQREFEGKHVLVTGGTKGIGAAVATRLCEGAATVLTTARTRPSDLADTRGAETLRRNANEATRFSTLSARLKCPSFPSRLRHDF